LIKGPRSRLRVALVLTSVAVLLTGCSYQDLRRPLLRNYAADVFYRPDRPIGKAGVVVDTEALAAALARWKQVYPANKVPYTVGQEDVLQISVHATGSKDATVYEVPVGEDGTVSLQLVGDVEVEGLATGEIEKKLTGLYQDGYYRNPVVNVYVSRYGAHQFYVSGAVLKPGIVPLTRSRISLLEALLIAGGTRPDAGDEVVVTRAAGAEETTPQGADAELTNAPADAAPEVVRISLEELIELSDMSRNIWIGPDDVVHIPRADPRKILVLGYVRAPGTYTLPPGEKLGVLDAVGLAQGVMAHARAESTRLLRRTDKGEVVYDVDLTRIAAGKEPDTILRSGDVVIVGTSWPIRALDGILGSGGIMGLIRTSP